MENAPVQAEKKPLSYQEAADAQDAYHQAADVWYRRFFMPHIASALGKDEDDGWELKLLVEKERHEKRARKLARKCIADVPVTVLVTGPTRAL